MVKQFVILAAGRASMRMSSQALLSPRSQKMYQPGDRWARVPQESPLSPLYPVPLEDVRNAWPAAEDATDGCPPAAPQLPPSSSGQSGSERYRRKPRFAGG